jgi:hypothetical protein
MSSEGARSAPQILLRVTTPRSFLSKICVVQHWWRRICRELGLLLRLTWIVSLAISDIVVSKAGPSINIVHSQKNISYILPHCWMHNNKRELFLTNDIDCIRKMISCHLRDCVTFSSSKLSPYRRLRSISYSGKYMHDLLKAPWKPFPARMLNL